MANHVWMSKFVLDSRLIMPMSCDLTSHKDLMRFWTGKIADEPTGDWPRPSEIWVDAEHSSAVGRLPDLFSVQSQWIVSRRLADILSRFDLGEGGLAPLAAFDKDRRTSLPGEYLSWTFNTVKRAFQPDRSNNLRKFLPGVATTRAVLADGDLACSRDAEEGRMSGSTRAYMVRFSSAIP